MAENTNVRFNIPTADLKALKAIAKQREVTLTRVVHEAVASYLNQQCSGTTSSLMRATTMPGNTAIP